MYEKNENKNSAGSPNTQSRDTITTAQDETTPSPLRPFSHSGPAQPRSTFHPDVPAHLTGGIPGGPARTPAMSTAPTFGGSRDAKPSAEIAPRHLVIGNEVCLKGGEISSCDHLTLNGSLEDTSLIDASHLEITPVGRFKGTAVVDNAVVAGKFEGSLTAKNRLTLCEGGEISGSVRYGSIVIEPGGKISGDMQNIDES